MTGFLCLMICGHADFHRRFRSIHSTVELNYYDTEKSFTVIMSKKLQPFLNMKKPFLFTPKAGDVVDRKFFIVGWIPKDWVRSDQVSLGLRGDGFGANVGYVTQHKGLIAWLCGGRWVCGLVDASYVQERIFYFEIHRDNQGSYDIALALKGGIPLTREQIIGKLEREQQYERDLTNYYSELEKINLRRKEKDFNREHRYLYGSNAGIGFAIYKILEESEESFATYEYSEEDRLEKELEEKYKDALRWRGPLFRGIVTQFSGFELRVYSDDHDNHFHVIHRGKGVNARFSFPDMKLRSYVASRTTISSKQEKRIRELALQPEIFTKFKQEFEKRI